MKFKKAQLSNTESCAFHLFKNSLSKTAIYCGLKTVGCKLILHIKPMHRPPILIFSDSKLHTDAARVLLFYIVQHL
jgi:hypothetical protein